MSKHIGKFAVTPELIIQALGLPEDTVLMNIYEDPDERTSFYQMVVEHDDLPCVLWGETIPQIYPRMRKVDSILELEDWGIAKAA